MFQLLDFLGLVSLNIFIELEFLTLLLYLDSSSVIRRLPCYHA